MPTFQPVLPGNLVGAGWQAGPGTTWQAPSGVVLPQLNPADLSALAAAGSSSGE